MITDYEILDEVLDPDALVIFGDPGNRNNEINYIAVVHLFNFWNSVDERLLRYAVSPDFFDHAHKLRVQGPEGALLSARTLHAAIPDFRLRILKLLFASDSEHGDFVTIQMRNTGHFTGVWQGPNGLIQGKGQAVDYLCTDIMRLDNGRITNNWPLEDNALLLHQMGVFPSIHPNWETENHDRVEEFFTDVTGEGLAGRGGSLPKPTIILATDGFLPDYDVDGHYVA